MKFFEICSLTAEGHDVIIWHNEWSWGTEALGHVLGIRSRKSALLRIVELSACPNQDCSICAAQKAVLSRVEPRNA
jgi:hypothetical protein